MSTRTIDYIETERLIYERLRSDHAPDFVALLLDPRVAAMLWPRPELPTEQEAIEALEGKIRHWERNGFGPWMLRDRQTGETLGRGGLQETFAAGSYEVEAGWAIVPERWGQGLATELALMSVEVAFQDLGLREVIAFARPENVASRRVMEKAGFRYSRDIEHFGLPHVLYVNARCRG